MNDKSCLVDAAAFHILDPDYGDSLALGCMSAYEERMFFYQRQVLVEKIGHDGSQRGFHTQELVDVLDEYTLTVHETFPCLQIQGGKIVTVFTKERAQTRMEGKLDNHSGLLVVRHSSGVHHALKHWKGGTHAMDCHKNKMVPIEELDVVLLLEIELRNENNSSCERSDCPTPR